MGEIKLATGIVVNDQDLHLYSTESADRTFEYTTMIANGQMMTVRKQYNLEAMKKLLANDEYFAQVVELIGNTNRAKLNINKIRSLSMVLDKNVFMALIQHLYDENLLQDVPEIDERINKLKSIFTLERIVFEQPTYTTNINGNPVTVETRDIMDFLTNGRTIDFETIDSLYGMTPKSFVYVVRKFTEDKKIHSNCMMDDEICQFVSALKQDEIIDTFSIDEINSTIDLVDPVKLNDDLVEYVLNNMPKDYTDVQKAIFTYLKLCKLFTYDEEFYAEQQSEESNRKHSDVSKLSEISPTNNSVVCYEINQIFAQFLKSYGIDYNASAIFGTYGNGHANLTFKADDYVVQADAVATILGSDLLNAKMHNSITGLVCKNKNSVLKTKFKKLVLQVTEDLKRLDPSPYVAHDSIDNWQKLISVFVEDPVDVTIKDKIDIFTDIAVTNTLPPTEKIAYLTKIYNHLFSKDRTTYMTIIKEKSDPNKFAKPTLVITYNAQDEITKFENNQYVLLRNNEWIDISREDLQKLFDKGILGSISDHPVPGIESVKEQL